jgi:hypothetical protein
VQHPLAVDVHECRYDLHYSVQIARPEVLNHLQCCLASGGCLFRLCAALACYGYARVQMRSALQCAGCLEARAEQLCIQLLPECRFSFKREAKGK